jgi:hypothetical protein
MIWMIRNSCILKRATGTNIKQPENNIKTYKVYLEMFDMCSISYSANVNVIHRRWLWPVKFALEGTVASQVGTPGLSHIPIDRSRIE